MNIKSFVRDEVMNTGYITRSRLLLILYVKERAENSGRNLKAVNVIVKINSSLNLSKTLANELYIRYKFILKSYVSCMGHFVGSIFIYFKEIMRIKICIRYMLRGQA